MNDTSALVATQCIITLSKLLLLLYTRYNYSNIRRCTLKFMLLVLPFIIHLLDMCSIACKVKVELDKDLHISLVSVTGRLQNFTSTSSSYKCKNEIRCRDDTVPKTVDTRSHCKVWLRACNNLPQPPKNKM